MMPYSEELFAELCHMLEAAGAEGALAHDTKLGDLKLDSLDIVEIAMESEQKWNIELEDAELENARTVGDFAELLYGKIEREKELVAQLAEKDRELDGQ